MGRELRRVPANWEHPKNAKGYLQPMHDKDYESVLREWLSDKEKWDRGLRPVYQTGGGHEWVPVADWEHGECSFTGYFGEAPDSAYYRPAWKESERTHFQMYEDTTEGTPISPVFDNVEDLCHWLADNGASAFGSMTATYEQWLATCRRGWAPGMIIEQSAAGSKPDAL